VTVFKCLLKQNKQINKKQVKKLQNKIKKEKRKETYLIEPKTPELQVSNVICGYWTLIFNTATYTIRHTKSKNFKSIYFRHYGSLNKRARNTSLYFPPTFHSIFVTIPNQSV
jgi:hypothetical protein